MAAEDGVEPRRPWLGYVCVGVLCYAIGIITAGIGARLFYEAARRALGL